MDQKISKLPSTLEKREMVYGKGNSHELLENTGKAYLDAGQVDEAALFFKASGKLDVLERLAGEAISSGDYFTFANIRKMIGRPPTKDELAVLSESARNQGKESFARRAEKAAREMEANGK